MGAEATRLFEEARAYGGLVGRMKLASLARITSTEAAASEDTPEMLARLRLALNRLRAEAAGAPAPVPSVDKRAVVAVVDSTNEEARLLRKQLQIYVDVVTQRASVWRDVGAVIRRIDEAASAALDVERVSIWFLDAARTKITCADLFVRATKEHASGVELFAKDFDPYFKALATERTIAAGDAHADPRTSCFSQSYLAPLGIASMLDVPIWSNDEMVGVICHEHVGAKRTWNADEESFGYLMSHFVARALVVWGMPPPGR
jgi:hypothetical protein